MVLLHHGGDRADHRDRLVGLRLPDVDGLEAAGQRRILLEILAVLGPGGGRDGAELAAGQGGLEQVGRVAGARRAAGADQGVGLVDEQDDRLGAGLHLIDHRAQPALELALHAGARLHQADVEGTQGHVAQHGGHVAVHDAAREALDHGGLADPGLAREDRVVLAAAQQDVDALADLGVAADDPVDLALLGPRREVDRILGQGPALAAGRLFARRREAFPGGGGGRADLAGARGDLLEAVAQAVDADLPELGAHVVERVLQALRLQHAEDQVARPHLARRELQAGVEPAVLHRLLHQGREVADRGRAPGQLVQRHHDVPGQLGVVELEGAADGADVVAAVLQEHVDPVDQLHVRVAPHLGEAGRRLDRLEARRVQPPEQRCA